MSAKMSTKILIADDEPNILISLEYLMKREGYEVLVAHDGQEALDRVISEQPALVLLDVMMPKKDGFALAADIRAMNIEVPIIFLTAKSMKEDILQGFKLGADDYLSKPFSMEELLYRIESILRRVRGKKSKDVVSYQIGGFTFDAQKQTLEFDGKAKKLTTKESELLNLLAANANNILERNFALKTIWVDDNYFNARSMDVYITKLRKLLKDDPNVAIINIHGKGYKLIMPQVKED